MTGPRDKPTNFNPNSHSFADAFPLPEDHPRRCIGINYNALGIKQGKRCGKFGLKGTHPPRCAKHHGRKNLQAQARLWVNKRMPLVYKKFLGPQLSAAIEAQLGTDPDEQVSLYSELALMREYAGNFVKIYSAAMELPADHPKRAELLLTTGAEMKAALESVSEVCAKAGKIAEKQKGRFTIHDLKHVIDRIMLLHYKICGEEHRWLAKALADAIESEMIIPSTKDKPTEQHQDQTHIAFDSEVPYVSDDDDDDSEE